MQASERRVGEPLVECVPGIPHEGAARFEVSRHLGAHVLDRLKRADRPAELVPYLRVFDRLIEHLPSGAEQVGREHEARRIGDAA